MSKSGRVNIPRSVTDPAYRYTMERMDAEKAGRGGNSHTVIKNIEQIAKDLNTLPQYIIKYFGLELGTESFYELNKRSYVSGHHQTESLNEILDSFIKKFICCKKCFLPELFMQVKKEQIFLNCQACGNHYEIFESEKLHKFILKNKPPKKTIKGKETNKIEEKQEKPEEEAPAAEASTKEGADAEAVEQSESKQEEEVNPVDVLQTFMQRKENATEEEIITAVKAMKGIYNLKEKTIACLLCESLLSEKVEILPLVEKYATIFAHFIKKQGGQEKVLGYIESFCTTDLNMPKISLILEKLYDVGVLSEAVVMSWYAEKKSKFVKKASVLSQIKMSAKPFVDWLEQAQVAEAK